MDFFMNIKSKITKFLTNNNFLDVDLLNLKSLNFGGNNSFILESHTKKISAKKIMNQYAGWTYAASRAIAEAIADIEIKLIEVDSKGNQTEITDHEILDLLHTMNKFQNGYEVIYNTAINISMAGNAYWFLDGVKSDKDKPTGIFFLPVQDVKVIRGKTIDEMIKGYEYRFDNKVTKLDFEQVLQFKTPDPNDMVEGVGVVSSIAHWIDEDNFATDFNRAFFKQGAKLGGFLETDTTLTDGQLERLSKSFDKIYSGLQNAHKVASLPKGVSFKDGQSSKKDMDFTEGQRNSRDKILAGFRVPKTILGAAEQETNRATAETAKVVFSENTVKPLMNLIIKWLNENLVPRYGDNLILTFDNPTPENREQNMEEMKAATAGQPVISVNEAREIYFDKDKIDNGDDVLKQISFVPLGTTTEQEKKALVIRSKANKGKKEIKKVSEFMAKDIVESIKGIEQEKTEKLKSIAEMSDDEFENVWKGFVSRVDPFEIQLFKEIQAYNKEQEKEVLSNLKSAIKAVDENKLFDEEKQAEILFGIATPIELEVFEQEQIASAEMIGNTAVGITPAIKESVEESVKLMAKSYNETTLKLLKEKLDQGIEEGLSFEALEKKVQEVYEFSDEVRARQVARTEVFRSANTATRQSWKESGVVETVKWYTAADERVCQFCFPMHNKIISIDDKFFEKGDTAQGIDGGSLKLDFTDTQTPPLHVSCRCYIRPESISI